MCFLCMHDMIVSHCSTQVFAGALGALAAMTVLSAVMGWAAPSLVEAFPANADCAAVMS